MEQSLRHIANRLRLGPLALQVYHTPKGFVKRCVSDGPVNIYLARQGRAEMEAAVQALQPLELPRHDNALPEVHFLTGAKFWYQTAFCAWSLMQAAQQYFTLVVYDDGSLEQTHLQQMRSIFPSIRVVTASEINDRIEQILPESKFPTLRERRINYPHIRKLTDVHAGLSGWKLVLDSDMLFFRRPDFLCDWLSQPQRPLYMQDIVTCYGYSNALMEEVTGHRIAECLNVGMCGLRSEDFDWDVIEEWARVMIERERTSYFQEQALTAMLLAGRECDIAPSRDYICKPSAEEVKTPTAVMHHYVADSKNPYFRFGWRNIVGNTSPNHNAIEIG